MQFGQIWNLFCGVNLFQYNSCLHRFHFDGQLAYKTLVIVGGGECQKMYYLPKDGIRLICSIHTVN